MNNREDAKTLAKLVTGKAFFGSELEDAIEAFLSKRDASGHDVKQGVEEGIDSSAGGFQHPEPFIVEAFFRAGKLIASAHAVFPVRSKGTGKWFPVVMFFDQDKKAFSYAFAMDTDEACLNLLELLYGCATECRKRNGGDI